MSIYVYKNNQQLGPFDENIVIGNLRSGVFSPNDLGIRQGAQQWLPLIQMFPQALQQEQKRGLPQEIEPPIQWANPPIGSPQVQINQAQAQPKSGGGGIKLLIFAVLGVVLLGILGVVGLAAFFILQTSGTQTANTPAGNSPAKPPANKGQPAPVVTDFSAIIAKAEELAALNPTQKLEAKPVIKGKVAIVKTDKYGAKLLGFDYTGKEYYSSDIERYAISATRLATKPEEIETLIQINCKKGKFIGSYEKGVSGYANDCKVSIIDYKAQAVIAQGNFTNADQPESISSVYKDGDKEFINIEPSEVNDFISSFPVDKLQNPNNVPYKDTTGSYGPYKAFLEISTPELARVSLPIAFEPNPAIKGKVAIAVKEADGGAKLEVIDLMGKEISDYGVKEWGMTSDKIATSEDQIDTLIQVFCNKGSKLGSVRTTTVYSNKCMVSIIDYKAGKVIAQMPYENKEMTRDIDTKLYHSTYVVLYPFADIQAYVKRVPKS